jgi:hypothetical protein
MRAMSTASRYREAVRLGFHEYECENELTVGFAQAIATNI